MNKIKVKKLLFVIDTQIGFIIGSLANAFAQAKVPNIVNKIKHWDGAIIATHDTHFTELQVKSAWPPEGVVAYKDSLEYKFNKLPEHCIKLSEDWQIHPDILAECEKFNKDKHMFFCVDKYTFGYYNWKKYLEDFEFEEIEICGFVSSICVLANAVILRAIYPNKRIVVDANCIADISEEMQQSAINCLRAQQIEVIE